MEVIIKGEANEIAALVLAVQERQEGCVGAPAGAIREAVQTAIGGIAGKLRDSSSPSSDT